MSDLIAVAYDDVQTAEQVRTRLFELQESRVISLADAVVVERTEKGKIKLHQSIRPGRAGAAGGAIWGGLIGLLFLAPLLGAAIGAAAGGAAGSLADIGVSDDLMKRLGTELKPGGAAVFVLVNEVTADKVLPEIQGYGGTIVQTSLSEEGEARLRDALAGSPATS